MDHVEMKPDDRRRQTDAALCRSALYGALSLGLHYPTESTLAALRSEAAPSVLRQSARLLSAAGTGPAEAAPEDVRIDLVTRVEDWLVTFPPLSLDRLLSAHGRLFGHTARGLVCPYEAEYGPEGLFQQPRRLANILGLYRAFGLTMRAGERERADHVSGELEFLDFLSRKEAYALESADEVMRETTRRAARFFLKEHLGRFARAFGRRLRAEDGDGFFGRLGDLLFDWVTLECRRLQVPAGPPVLRLRPEEEARVPMACGGESELVQLET